MGGGGRRAAASAAPRASPRRSACGGRAAAEAGLAPQQGPEGGCSGRGGVRGVEVPVDEPRRGAVVAVGVPDAPAAAPEAPDGAADAAGELLPELDAPLVERVDPPEEALHHDAVLVDGEQLPDGEGRELGQEEAEGGAVPVEGLVRDELGGDARGGDLLGRPADRQGVGLREEVAHELVVVADELPAEPRRLLRPHDPDEVAGHDAALVDELVERVLPVGAGLPKVDLAGLRQQRGAVDRHALAVALHRQLLHVRRELPERLLVRQDGPHRVPQEGDVPHRREAHQHGDVAVRRRAAEVAVHVPEPRQEPLDHREAILQSEWEDPDGRGDRVAPTDPLPEAKHVGRLDAKLLHEGVVGADGDDVPGDRALAEPGDEPGAHRPGVEHRLRGGEGLGDHHDEGRLRVEVVQLARQVHGVHVGDEAQPPPPRCLRGLGVRRERRVHKERPEEGAPDPDGDHVGEGLPRAAAALAAADAVAQGPDPVQHLPDHRDDVHSLVQHHVVPGRPQRRVEHRAALRRVYPLPAEHSLHLLFHFDFLGKLDQKRLGPQVHSLPGVVQENAIVLGCQGVTTLFVLQ
mmetsp:Transcript_41490/g.98314  ORF Transcript_41490/g.98314 Transcript_41490/m.98314 type:complete len:576 (-) Transcript_41490:352-2079(-)